MLQFKGNADLEEYILICFKQCSVCVCVCVCARACADACVFWTLHMCLQVCVCGRSRGRREGERMWEWDIYIYIFYVLFYCYFKCTFLSLEPMCQRKMFMFMLCILMNNKDLFDWFDLVYIILTNSEPATIFANRQYRWWHAWKMIATDSNSIHGTWFLLFCTQVCDCCYYRGHSEFRTMTVMHMILSLDKMFHHGETKTLT